MSEMNRRAALKVLGVLPLAGVVEAQQPAQPPQAPRQPHATPNQPATPAGAPATTTGGAAPKRQFFTAREWRTAGVLADDVIPRDDRSGSATDAGVPAYMDFHLALAETSDDARTQMRGGLRWMDAECRRRFGVDYHRATESQRHQILDDVAGPPAQAKPEFRHGATFFNAFRNMVASGFFSSAIGWKDLRYQGNVFNPNWQGCPQPALDKLGVSYDLMATRVAPQPASSR